MTMRTRYMGGRWFLLIMVFAVFVYAGALLLNDRTVCEGTIAYDIGTIEDNFNITKEQFKGVLADSERVWEEGMGLDLFAYIPGAKFSVNLIFDERQRKTIAERRAREVLDRGGDTYDALTRRYNGVLSIHKIKADQYEVAVSSYEKRLTSYNDNVAHYNAIGGAPKKKYEELEKERAILEKTAAQLNQASTELNELGVQIKALAEDINVLAEEYNIEVARYNNAFGVSMIFDQGEYVGDGINIYQFDTVDDLRLVAAHEFGHALGLEHTEGPSSVMYYMMEEQNPKAPVLSEEDISALKIECKIK